MKAKHVRELSSQLIRDLGLDTSATIEAVCGRLCEVVAERIGEPVILRFDDLGASCVSGLWAVTEDGTNVIIVTTVRSWTHRLLILLHEVAHILCGHKPAWLSDEDGRRLLFPDLPSAMLTILAGRTDMSEVDECEADRVAGALTRELITWANRQCVRLVRPDENRAAERLGYTLGFSLGGSADE